ncbi:hypothetical protein FC093_11780 [Ilyomonas limi]|uniref:Outer membrane protein beta-barrel domain-containing protein n=2 Tax=Ilyomonas limi TaxID=2575867 RepID=A0A4U3L0K2_9BACT|nr:hypothetical protein FC093_11780 [Ilyomonas limi]
MRKLTQILLIVLASTTVHAQQATVKGNIYDTINKEHLSNTVIALLRSHDSVLYKFTRSDKDGNFSLQHIIPGKYIVLITENTYADYLDSITINSDTTIALGRVPMTLKANLLKEVIVQQQIAAMRMRGDTLEYAADSFKVRQGASVEEMLKRLPGVQVDKDGKITAQGETVEKVLVDGEEFFGDDPTIATKNLQADAIDKVQVFDKKSDQAEFTGIDDGQKTKTINLKLKADKKKGSFGKVDLASDFQNRWNNSAMINNFKGSVKLSGYGIMSSTGKTGLDWGESEKYGGGNGMQYDEESGGFYINFDNNDDLNNASYYGEGLPKSWSAGLNLSDKFDDDNQSLNGSYRYNKLNTLGSGKTISESRLPGNTFISRDSGTNFSSRQRHSANAIYEWKIDSSTSVKLTGSGYTGTTLGSSISNSFTTNKAGIKINDSYTKTASSGENQNLNVNFLLRKKFKKAGRSLSLNINEQYNSNNSTGTLYGNIHYYDDTTGVMYVDSLTDQLKKNSTSINTIASKITYTEPIIKKLFVEVNYALRSYTANSKKLSYDRDDDGKFSQLNDIYSNDYRFDVLTNTGGAAFRYNGKKVTASAGTDVGFTNFTQKDLMNDTTYKRDYTNFFPKANFTYKINSTSRFQINYNGSTSQPTINQIQPVKDNSNLLVETIGNPDLKQAFNHRIFFNFNSYKVLSQRGFYVYGSFNTTSHAIVTDQSTDLATGKTTLKYFNRNGNYNFYSGGGYNMKLKKLDMFVNAGFDYTGSRYSNRVNNKDNTTNNQAPGVRIGLQKYKEKKYNFYYNSSFFYNFSKSSIQESNTTNYWTQEHNFNANITLPWKLEINTDLQVNLRQKTPSFTENNNVFLWNAYIGRRLLKNDKAIIKIQGYDILNQNKGYSRSINTNITTERNYETIRRYFVLAFTWNFSKSAMDAQPAAQ